jgi:hypothetical protein
MDPKQTEPRQEVDAPELTNTTLRRGKNTMTTATETVNHAISVRWEDGKMMSIDFPSLAKAREAADPALTQELEGCARSAGLTAGDPIEDIQAFMILQLMHSLHTEQSDYIRLHGGRRSFYDFAAERFAKLVVQHTALMDFAYRMSGLDPEDTDQPALFGMPLFSYHGQGHVRGNAFWDVMEDNFFNLMEEDKAFAVQDARIAAKPAKKNAKRKAASKARKASRKK